MFQGEDGEDYHSIYSFGRSSKSDIPDPKVEIKGEGVEPVQQINPISIEPPSAERMLKRLRSKLAGKGLKEI